VDLLTIDKLALLGLLSGSFLMDDFAGGITAHKKRARIIFCLKPFDSAVFVYRLPVPNVDKLTVLRFLNLVAGALRDHRMSVGQPSSHCRQARPSLTVCLVWGQKAEFH
jgi:hypothetical protein